MKRSHMVGGLLMTLAAFISSAPASANPVPQLTVANSGGGAVSIAGTGFIAGDTVVVWVDINGNGVLDLDEPAIGVSVDSTGALCLMPPDTSGNGNNQTCIAAGLQDVPAGSYSVQAGSCQNFFPGSCVGTKGVTSAPLTIPFSTSPNHFGSGTHVTVTGLASSANGTVNVWYDNQPNGQLGQALGSVSVPTDQTGAFTTVQSSSPVSLLQVNASPGDYFIHAGPSTTPTLTAQVHVDSCWLNDYCFIDGVNVVCILGNSPSDFFSIFADCKNVDFDYTKPTLKTPAGGYDLTNAGPVFPGAGALSAATSDFDPAGPPLPGVGCPAITTAIQFTESAYNYASIPDSGLDFDPTKYLKNLTDIACGIPDPLFPLPPLDLAGYVAVEAAFGSDVPDSGLLLGSAALVNALADGAVALTLGAVVPVLTSPPFDLPPDTGALAATGALDAAALGPVILTGAQAAFAQAAVAEALFCGFVDYQCKGSDLTANIMANPSLQMMQIPVPFLPAPNPNPCPSGLSGPCWGSVIGWAQVACTNLDPMFILQNGNQVGTCEQDHPLGSGTFPLLPQPGTAGAGNSAAPERCVNGTVLGLSIGYDGDAGFDVYDPSIFGDPADPVNHPPLVNYHNFEPGPGGSDAPNGIDVEIPLADWFAQDAPRHAVIAALRPGMFVHVCGHHVADMHQLWNELHPVTQLSILPQYSIASAVSDVTIQAGETASYPLTTTLLSGPSDAITLSATVQAADTGLPMPATLSFAPPTVTPSIGSPSMSTLMVSSVPVGDYNVVIQAQNNGQTKTISVNLHVYDYTISVSQSDETVLRGGSASYALSLTLVAGSSTQNIPALGLAATGISRGCPCVLRPSNADPSASRCFGYSLG